MWKFISEHVVKQLVSTQIHFQSCFFFSSSFGHIVILVDDVVYDLTVQVVLFQALVKLEVPLPQTYHPIPFLSDELKEFLILLNAKKLVNWIPNVKVWLISNFRKLAFSTMDLPDKLCLPDLNLNFWGSEVLQNSAPMIACVGKKLFPMWMLITKSTLCCLLVTN